MNRKELFKALVTYAIPGLLYLKKHLYMNTYSKYAPNVWLAKCTEKHEKGTIIPVATKYGKENDSIVFNLIYEKDGFYFYSIVRADGFNYQQWAQRRADRRDNWSVKALNKSKDYYQRSKEVLKFLTGEPVKLGHHSQRRHERDLEKIDNNMCKSIEFAKKVKDHASIAEYWESKAKLMNESMPESIEFFEYKLEIAQAHHKALKDDPSKRSHGMSLQYAKNAVNEIQKKLDLARRLWQ